MEHNTIKMHVCSQRGEIVSSPTWLRCLTFLCRCLSGGLAPLPACAPPAPAAGHHNDSCKSVKGELTAAIGCICPDIFISGHLHLHTVQLETDD